jgi:hypothetical protein
MLRRSVATLLIAAAASLFAGLSGAGSKLLAAKASNSAAAMCPNIACWGMDQCNAYWGMECCVVFVGGVPHSCSTTGCGGGGCPPGG